jgi:hypothetical protein
MQENYGGVDARLCTATYSMDAKPSKVRSSRSVLIVRS